MTLFPFGMVCLLIGLWFFITDTKKLFLWASLLVPFSMAAAVELSGMSLVTYKLLLLVLSCKVIITNLMDRKFLLVNRNTLLFFIYCIYCSVTLIIPVYFHGEIQVVLLSDVSGGVRIDPRFPSSLSPLILTKSNVAQLIYLYISFITYISVRKIINRYGFELVNSAVIMMAVANISLGLISLIYPEILSPIRTANYSLLSHHEVEGFKRVIGGTSEASAYGSISLTIGVFIFVLGLLNSNSKLKILAAFQLLMGILSFSSTAYIGLFLLLIIIIMLSILMYSSYGISKKNLKNKVIISMIVVLMLSTMLYLTGLVDFISNVLNKIIFEKALSDSGLERTLLAEYGIKTFLLTFTLGAGIGSIMSNGFFSVMLGSVGLVGTFLFLYFIVKITSGVSLIFRINKLLCLESKVKISALAAFLIQFGMMVVSQTTPEINYLFIFFLAVMSTSKNLPVTENK